MVIFFDIDGTLIDEKTQILPDSTAQAIPALLEAGHVPVVNTGRPYTHLDPRVRALPFAGWICAGGQEVMLRGEWLKKQTVPTAWLPEIIASVRKNHLQVVYEAEGGFYLDAAIPASHPEVQFQCELRRSQGGYVRDIGDGIDHDIVKFCVFEIPGSGRTEFVKEMETRFNCILRRGMVELILQGNSKAKGMELMLQTLGCPWDSTMAFGDSGNDLPMLQAAGIGVCMGGGAEEAKAAADFVTKTVLDDGIAHALKHFEILK